MASIARAQPAQHERVFIDNGEVLVTDTRFQRGPSTIPIDHVALYAYEAGPVPWLWIGLLLFFAVNAAITYPLFPDEARWIAPTLASIFIAGAIAMAVFRNRTLRVTSSSGEAIVIPTRNGTWAAKVVEAIDAALLERRSWVAPAQPATQASVEAPGYAPAR